MPIHGEGKIMSNYRNIDSLFTSGDMTTEKERKSKLIKRLHILLDICLTITAFVGSYFIRRDLLSSSFDGLSVNPNYYIVLLIIMIIWFVIFNYFNIYDTFTEKNFSGILIDLLKAAGTSLVFLIAILFILRITDVSRFLLTIFFITNLLLLVSAKYVLYRVLKNSLQSYQNIRNLLIVGGKNRAVGFIRLVMSSRKNYNIIGCLETDEDDIGKEVHMGVKVIGTIEDLKRIVVDEVVDEVVFAMPLKKIDNVDGYMILIEMLGKTARILPDWQIHSFVYQPGICSVGFDDFMGAPTMVLCPTSRNHHDLFIKMLLDYSVALIVTIGSLPLMIITGIMIKITSKGPIFFRQERMGLNGRRFRIYKFRTMVMDAERKLKDLKKSNEMDGPAFKIKNDPRIIPFIGSFLRKTSLDELPQVINILRGEMSLVGPRPPLPEEVNEYGIWQRRRLSMKPGLTCLWQIQPNRNEISFNKWMKMDLSYIDNWTLKLDFTILWKTALVVLAGYGR